MHAKRGDDVPSRGTFEREARVNLWCLGTLGQMIADRGPPTARYVAGRAEASELVWSDTSVDSS